MSHQYSSFDSSFDCTSADFEKAALNRFRSLVIFLPQDCKVFREPWECSTILCLDFANCPDYLHPVKGQAHLLVNAAQELGLANAIIFRIGSRFMGWMGNTNQ
jgi:hypothetical protein